MVLVPSPLHFAPYAEPVPMCFVGLHAATAQAIATHAHLDRRGATGIAGLEMVEPYFNILDGGYNIDGEEGEKEAKSQQGTAGGKKD